MVATVRALFIGRFQPFHRGHLKVVVDTAAWADELILGIAAATDSFSLDNPFTAGERAEMLDLAMREAGISRARTVALPDIHNHAIWAGYVVSLCPPFDVLVGHNPVTLELFRREGHEVREVPLYSRSRYSGTRVRRLMAEGDASWEGLVPPAVARYIRDIDGDGRMRRMAGAGAPAAPRRPAGRGRHGRG